ncbi:hypothetical protein PCASD_09766 [Puccinia coronata f. sp. avenae]|uniref:Uncharacterized protein n=1 Tax=Puccinia coronata f. sp. avenae TaxID=200324 RepID=A0A2N5U6B5_9BASI|nr:hypothetical protein PCASD_14595 [Puccinia coronata f. sp. avenae]PLW33272.1 hypothetical protein PCASD_09766 [Puccinia coronata f. sp. avenae]
MRSISRVRAFALIRFNFGLANSKVPIRTPQNPQHPTNPRIGSGCGTAFWKSGIRPDSSKGYQVINLIKNDFWSQVAVKSLKNDKILVPENPVKPAPGPGIRQVRLRMGEIRIRGAGSEP